MGKGILNGVRDRHGESPCGHVCAGQPKARKGGAFIPAGILLVVHSRAKRARVLSGYTLVRVDSPAARKALSNASDHNPIAAPGSTSACLSVRPCRTRSCGRRRSPGDHQGRGTLAHDSHRDDSWVVAFALLFAAGLLFPVRHFRRRAYGLAEVGFAVALFAYAFYSVRSPTELVNLIFQTGAAIYVAIHGFDNIVLFHKRS
jgi:hypothetical protein